MMNDPRPGHHQHASPARKARTRDGRAPFIVHTSSFVLCGLLAASLLGPPGCSSSTPGAPNVVTGTPTPTPTSSVIVGGAKGTLMVTVKDNLGQAVANVPVEVRGLVTLDATTDSQGVVTFSGVPADSNYTVVTTPPGFGVASRSQVAVTGDQGSSLILNVAPAASVSGRVADGSGNAIAGAVVSDGTLSAMTGSDGKFVLTGISSGSRDIQVAKTGFQPATKSAVRVNAGNTTDMGTLALTPLGRPLQVLFDSSKSPLGGTVTLSSFFADLIKLLQGQGYQVTVGPANGGLPSLVGVDVLVITAPGQSYSSTELTTINNFVATGHKLILLGEWNGLNGVSNTAINGLTNTFNLSVNADLVKDFDANNQLLATDPDTGQRAKRPDYVVVRGLLAHPLTANVRSLAVFESASVSIPRPAVSAPDPNSAAVVARTGLQGLQVAQLFNSNYGVLGAALSGTGTVVVSGDSSLWSSTDSDSSGAPDLQKQNNRTLALNAFAW